MGRVRISYLLLLLLSVGNVQASVNEKVVELHITRRTQEETLDARKRLKVSNKPTEDRHYVCSGGFIDSAGDIITARHCQEGASSIEVVTSDNQHYAATIIAVSSQQDLALLHIDRSETPYFVIASSVSHGEEVSTFGSPLAITSTQSWGRVARLDGDLLFLDESVLPGNSGGVVFNKREELVGVATAVAIVGAGVTHLAIAESRNAVWFFLMKVFVWHIQP